MSKRREEEKKEGMMQIDNNAPATKFQDAQQVAESDEAKFSTTEGSFVPKKQENKGTTLKQDVAAKVIKDASYGGSLAGDGASFGGMRSSGNGGGILGAANMTPVAGKSRSDSRISKKLDRNSTKLNFIPNDTTLVEWDESKPLAEAKDKDQGFNGTYRNEYARAQKNREAVPGALMFDRSVDLITKDNLYFGQGQVVKQYSTSDILRDDVTKTAVKNYYGVYENSENDNYTAGESSNYITDELEVQLAIDGNPAYMVFHETEVPVDANYVDAEVANKSSAANHILSNDAELVRESMDSKAGDEKADIWTPLARAVQQPTQTVGFLRDIEAEVGNEILTAYRKASTSMSYQLNRAHKDGQDVLRPAIEAMLGLNRNDVSSANFNGYGAVNDVFHRDNYLNGEAATMIPLYDSASKYNSKADLLIQPRGYRMHLQTADNNIDPLHVDKLFATAYDASETFSTIGREFDPMAPVCLTDKCKVVHRHSWHRLGSFINRGIMYHVVDRNQNTTSANILIPADIVSDLTNAERIYVIYPHEALGDLEFNGHVVAPSSTYEFASGNTFQVIIGDASAAPVVGDDYEILTINPANIDEDYPLIYDGHANNNHCYAVDYCTILPDFDVRYMRQGGPFKYMYSDLRNGYVTTVAHPLLEGLKMYFAENIGAKYFSLIHRAGQIIYDLAPIHIQTVHSTQFFSLWSFILCAATPYIIKSRINSFRDVLYYEKNVEYPFSSTLTGIKDVLTKAYANFNYKDYDTELETGIMKPSTSLSWILPELFQQVGYSSSESKVLLPWYSNQKDVAYRDGAYAWDDDSSNMSMPSVRSGVKLASVDTLYGMDERDIRLSCDMIASFKSFDPTLSGSRTYKYSSVGDGQLILSANPAYFTAYNFLCLPRQLGYVVTAPYGTLTPRYDGRRDYGTSILGTSSFACKYWFGANPTVTADDGQEAILNPITININRGQNFTQEWYNVLASGTVPPLDHGFVLSLNQCMGAAGANLAGRNLFHPYTSVNVEGNGVNSANMNGLLSLQKALWTRIQKLPFIISPFDGVAIDNADHPNSVVICDPYDFLYYFGVGGFRASDFRESVYNREKQAVNQGILFVSDPWVEQSPLFHDGAISSGIVKTSGFQI